MSEDDYPDPTVETTNHPPIYLNYKESLKWEIKHKHLNPERRHPLHPLADNGMYIHQIVSKGYKQNH